MNQFINKFPIMVKPAIFGIIKGDLEVYWLITKLMNRVDLMQKNCWPSKATLQADTGFGRDKLGQVIKRAEKLGLLRREARMLVNGSQTSNNYTITTDLIGFLVYSPADQVYDSKATPPTEIQYPPHTEIQYPNYNKTIELSKEEQIKNFQLDDMRKMMLEKQGFNLELYELELANWIDYLLQKLSEKKELPKNLHSSFTNWCLNATSNHERLRDKKKKNDAKTKEKIYQASVDNYERKNVVDIYQRDNETDQDFHQRVLDMESLTGSFYKKHYRNRKTKLGKEYQNLVKNIGRLDKLKKL